MNVPRGTTTISVALVAFSIVLPTMAQQSAEANKMKEASRGRERAMQELAADSRRILDSLKTLTKEQRNAVVALIAVAKATAAYESHLGSKYDSSLRAVYEPLRQFSPAYAAPRHIQVSINGCFAAWKSCAQATEECSGRSHAGSCDGDPKVVEPCANEAMCFTREFIKLHHGMPEILGGRDPFPPHTFPGGDPVPDRP